MNMNMNRKDYMCRYMALYRAKKRREEDLTEKPNSQLVKTAAQRMKEYRLRKKAENQMYKESNLDTFERHTNMGVKVHSTEEDEVMEVDLTTENGHADKPLVVNGILKHIPSNIQLKFEEQEFCNIDIEGSFLKCSAIVLKTYKHNIDDQAKNLCQSVKKAQSIAQEIDVLSQKLDNVYKETKSLFQISVNNNVPPYPKTYSRNGAVNNVQPKPVLNSSIRKEQVASEGLEILNTVNSAARANLPPSGELVRSPIGIGSRVWAMKTNLLNVWVKGTITNVKEGNNNEKLYKVRFDNLKHISPKPVPAKYLAYENPASVIIPVGTRIIARYTDSAGRSAHYAGIVAEPPKITNCKRYLVFFDDGCAQYVKHEDTYVVCTQSVDVADDVHENISDFVRGYLQQYPERPMVKLAVDQFVKTEYNFEWSDAKVLEVDCSMVKMLFLTSQRVEWIYRGSTRLKPLRNELANAEAHRLEGKNRRRHNIPRRPHQPYIEYTREDVVVLDSDSDDDKSSVITEGTKAVKPKNTARKSLATRPFKTLNVKNAPVYRVTDKKSHLGYKDTSRIKSFVRIPFHVHDCGYNCRERDDPARHKGKNPYLIPILLGWERQLRKYRACGPGPKQVVIFRSSCGRHLRNLQDIQNFLSLIKSRLTVDLFSFDSNVNIFRSFRPKEVFFKDDDITCGKENVPVSCVNSLSNEPPPYVEYSAERFPGEGVFLNLDEEFLCGCDCTDNCQNPETCLCQQHTNYARYGTHTGDAGYKFRRLREPVVTGIYECNSRCKCNFQCGNRVVQNGLTVRLQMFKTQYKGWGIRCLDDIDAGQFICVYAGQLLTEQGADQDGKECGDEYLAELDHIEVVEKTKEGYESDVPELSMDVDADDKSSRNDYDNDLSSDDQYAGSSDSDIRNCDSDSEFESSLRSTATSTYATRSRQRSGKRHTNSTDSYLISEDSSSCAENIKSLPDIGTNLAETFKINPRPPSPESAEALEKIELKRKPRILDGETLSVESQNSTENKVDDQSVPQKVVAKKSVSMTKPLSSLQYDHKEYKFKSVRSFFGEDSLYIMDAKSKGNIGRYLNHSCEPNVFVQNVFVDTHDLRFPAVAFFAHDSINAGTELTWDYNYEVGSVADKVMYCYCEAPSCRGRLL